MNDFFVNTDQFPVVAQSMYFIGAGFWLATYAFLIYRIFKMKFVEFPALVITANVAWEVVGAFLIYPPLPFGGDSLMYGWYFGAALDLFMLGCIYAYGRKQITNETLKQWWPAIITFAFFGFGALTYFYVEAGYDLPMMFNSGMILNTLMSVMCILLFLQHPNYRFHPFIPWGKFLATSVFYMIYLLIVKPDAYFSITMGVICFVLDVFYIVMTHKRWRALKPAA